MEIIYNNNLNFTSLIKTDGLQRNKLRRTRFENIGKIIEAKTAKIKDYTIDIADNHDEKKGIALYFFNSSEEHTAIIPEKYLKKLLENSDEKIANKIAKLQRIFVKRDKTVEIGNKFFYKIMKNDKYHDPADFETKFYDALVDKCSADQKEAVQRDNILQNFDVWG